jgi:hypothetical protein
LDVEVPPGATAQIELPAASPAAVTESGAALAKARGILRVLNTRQVTIVVGSGSYRFEVAGVSPHSG